MAIIINDNLAVNVGKPIDSKYLDITTKPWASISAANAGIPLSYRYSGLTILIQSGVTNVEYWYLNGITNTDLVQKKFATIIPLGNFVTGGTNIGYFSGMTGVQHLCLDVTFPLSADYAGIYNSLYNYYFRGTDCVIRIGAGSDNIPKRGYVKTISCVKSWLWNDANDYSQGWILVDGNISNCIGCSSVGVPYYPPSTPYTASTWTTSCNCGSNVTVSCVTGSLTTGSSITIGGPVFGCMAHNNLHFRTLYTQTPNLIKITNDEAFVYLSGSTGNQLLTASNGLTKIGQDVRLGGTLTGTTIITDGRVTSGRTGIVYGGDYRATFVDNSLVSKCYVDSKLLCSVGGERIFKTICQPSHSFAVNNVIGFSGGTYNLPIANGLYDGEVLGIVTKCFNVDCFELTQAGYVSGLTPVFTMNCTYFLSATQAGCLTTSEPITPNFLSKSMLIATSSSTGWVLPYAAYVITSGVTGGALIKNVCNISSSPYAVTCSDYYIGAKGGDIVQLMPNINGAAINGQVIIVADVCGNAIVGCPVQINGYFFGGSSTSCIDTAYGSISFIYNGGKSCWGAIGFSQALVI
jgi:hypothetical protein